MNKRESILKIVLLITILLCTASKGYEIYVSSANHSEPIIRAQPSQIVYYRLSAALEDREPVVSNVIMVWKDEDGEAKARIFGQGDFELFQEKALKMDFEDVKRLEQRLCELSDEEYIFLVKNMKENPERYAKQ